MNNNINEKNRKIVRKKCMKFGKKKKGRGMSDCRCQMLGTMFTNQL